jgi:hypothetical protein
VHIGEHHQYDAGQADPDAEQLPQAVLRLEEDPGEEDDAGDRPAVKEHHARQGRVLVSLHDFYEQLKSKANFSVLLITYPCDEKLKELKYHSSQ